MIEPGSNVASCGPLTTSHASSPAGNCTHSVEISAPATPQGKELLAQVAQLVDAVPEARSNQRSVEIWKGNPYLRFIFAEGFGRVRK